MKSNRINLVIACFLIAAELACGFLLVWPLLHILTVAIAVAALIVIKRKTTFIIASAAIYFLFMLAALWFEANEIANKLAAIIYIVTFIYSFFMFLGKPEPEPVPNVAVTKKQSLDKGAKKVKGKKSFAKARTKKKATKRKVRAYQATTLASKKKVKRKKKK